MSRYSTPPPLPLHDQPDGADAERLGGRHDRVLIRIAVGVVVPELADRDRQPGVDEGVEVGADLVGGVEHAVHVDREHGVGGRVAGEHLGAVVAHGERPVLAPVRCVGDRV
jgi:hypothetical protein